MNLNKPFEIIPEFQHIFEKVPVETNIFDQLSQHNEDSQREIFDAFRKIFEDEILFVLTCYTAAVGNKKLS